MISRADLHERGKNVVIKSVNLETVVGITSALPENTLPEYAFAGKSNVGKSSLINAVMNRKAYAEGTVKEKKVDWFAIAGVVIGAVVANLVKWGFPAINGMAVAAVCYLCGKLVCKK